MQKDDSKSSGRDAGRREASSMTGSDGDGQEKGSHVEWSGFSFCCDKCCNQSKLEKLQLHVIVYHRGSRDGNLEQSPGDALLLLIHLLTLEAWEWCCPRWAGPLPHQPTVQTVLRRPQAKLM